VSSSKGLKKKVAFVGASMLPFYAGRSCRCQMDGSELRARRARAETPPSAPTSARAPRTARGPESYNTNFGVSPRTRAPCAAMGSWFQGPLSPLPGAVSLWLVLTPAYGGGMLVFRRFSRRLGDGSLSPPDSWWRNFAVGLLVFVPSWLVTALVMTSIGNRPDARAVMTLAAGAIATGFFALGGGLLVLRRLGLAAPPSPRLAAIIERVSR